MQLPHLGRNQLIVCHLHDMHKPEQWWDCRPGTPSQCTDKPGVAHRPKPSFLWTFYNLPLGQHAVIWYSS